MGTSYEPVFEVVDARLGHCDQLILLVKEGRPLEIMEPYDISSTATSNDAEEGAADNESGTDGS